MMEFFRKHKVTIILIILVGFFGGTFITGFGISTFGKASSFDAVAIVNGKQIPYKYFYSLYNNTINSLHHSGKEITEELATATKNNIVRTLIQDVEKEQEDSFIMLTFLFSLICPFSYIVLIAS